MGIWDLLDIVYLLTDLFDPALGEAEDLNEIKTKFSVFIWYKSRVI